MISQNIQPESGFYQIPDDPWARAGRAEVALERALESLDRERVECSRILEEAKRVMGIALRVHGSVVNGDGRYASEWGPELCSIIPDAVRDIDEKLQSIEVAL